MRASINFLWSGTIIHKFKRLIDQDRSRAFPQASPRDVLVAFEAVVILFRENISKSIIGQPEEQIMFSAHLAFEVIPDIREGFARNREDLRVAEVNQVH